MKFLIQMNGDNGKEIIEVEIDSHKKVDDLIALISV